MSSSLGQVRFNDGTVLHFKYRGSTDSCIPNLYTCSDQAWDNDLDLSGDTNGVRDSESVTIAIKYGNGRFWEGKASKSAMMITDGLRHDRIVINPECPFGSDVVIFPSYFGLPDWYQH